MNTFQQAFTDYISSGHALLHINTFEKDRAISQIVEVAKEIDREVRIWSAARGWRNLQQKKALDVHPKDPPEDQLKAIGNSEERTVFILKDFGFYLRHTTYENHDVVISWLDEFKRIIASVGQTIVFVGPDLEVPKPLLHDITRIEFSLPDEHQIRQRIDFVCDGVSLKDGKKFKPNKDALPHIIDACRGMTSQQITDRVALAVRQCKALDQKSVTVITKEKASVVNASGVLKFEEPPEGGLSIVGGYNKLKQHVILDKPCFTKEARKFGIEFPRGLMLVGIPGCGKTLLSLAIASELNLPLIAMDVGNLMDKLVGESESNMREAIKMLESIAPCVLQLDEIEKGFGGAGDMDGGTSRRVFGTFLKWLNDRKSPVYIIATANQVQSLPPEFCRKGRFDEIYGLDLPNLHERQEIFNIHLSKRNRHPENFNTKELASSTDGYTGADIEEIVKLGLKMAFADDKEITTEYLQKCIPEIIPLSQTEAGRIAEIREWCKGHAKPANPSKSVQALDTSLASNRRVDIN